MTTIYKGIIIRIWLLENGICNSNKESWAEKDGLCFLERSFSSQVLTLQRLEEQFCDVTLVSDDGFVMKAHQAILASTSAYFQRVLSEVASDQYPMIVLRGAKFREMSCLLDYMYQGNTQVSKTMISNYFFMVIMNLCFQISEN